MTTIDNEYALPAPPEDYSGRLDYIRSKCDPRYMIAGKSGEVYVRTDGQPWEWPGYEISRKSGGAVECTPATAHEDSQRIKPKQQAA